MIDITQARKEDIPRIVELFMSSFSDSIKHIFGEAKSNPTGLIDLFGFIYNCEPESVFVAREQMEKGNIVGYIISPRSMRRLWFLAVIKGYIFKWFIRWVKGDYGVGLTQVKTLLKNKLGFILTPYNYTHTTDAQILSIAVAQEMRGKGIGSLLLEQAMKYLNHIGVQQIKLEVRPGNISARRMYKNFGFIEEGNTRDSQGEWIVMMYRKKRIEKGG
jgi:ribosomal protein S18 acetylase RimI-like enzyme